MFKRKKSTIPACCPEPFTPEEFEKAMERNKQEEQKRQKRNKEKQFTDEFEQKLADSMLSKFEIKIQYYCHIKLYYPDIPKWQYSKLFKLCWRKICNLRNNTSNSGV